VELRQYTLRPGKRDVLIDIFEREFVRAQERYGIEVVGQLRDLDHPNRFVWLRGFPGMSSRPRMLKSFYSCPVWVANRDAVNEILVDYDNVLLLRDAWEGSGFFTANTAQNNRPRATLVTVDIHYLCLGAINGFASLSREKLEPFLEHAGADGLAALVTETAPNNYPRLPMREGECAFVSFHTFESLASYDSYLELLDRTAAWRGLRTEMERWYAKPSQTLRLTPTALSRLR
jgi:hypothetical protein